MNRILLTLCVAALVAGCAPTSTRFQIPPPQVAGQPLGAPDPGEQVAGTESPGSVQDDTGPAAPSGVTRVPAPARTSPSLQQADWSSRFPSNDSIAVAVDAMPLKDFVNYSFSEALKANYVLAQDLPGLDDPVTLNLERPVSSRAYYKLVTELLSSRGIGTTFRDGVFYVAPAGGKVRGNIPMGFGRRSQDVPDVAGKIMQVIPLRFGAMNPNIESTIVELVDAQVKIDQQQNAIFVTGERDAILRALDVVNLLDQPASRAREVGLVNLNYVSAKEIAEQLVTILGNEGIPAAVGRGDLQSVAIVPLEQLATLVVFAQTAEMLHRVDFWVKQLDRPNQGPEERYFIFHPRYARASDLGASMAPLLGGALPDTGNLSRDTRSALGADGTVRGGMNQLGTASGNAANASDRNVSYPVTQQNVLRRDTGAAPLRSDAVAVRGEGLTMSVDPRSNTLIFFTTGARYQTLLPMIQRLDVPPKQILLETMIAEVTLTGEFAYGVEFAFTSGNFSGGTAGGLNLPSGGLALNWIDSITQQVRVKLSATNTLVNVLSNPTLVVRDGVEASIIVGNDVPTIGATATDPLTSDTQITQVLYRKTGLDLRIRPTINAAGVVVMEITQSISNTVPGASNVEGAPIFFERAVTTEVVARSGESILLAGLISERQNDSSSSVPGFAQIPGLGWLFRSDSKGKERTELVVLITPRVIEDPREWDQIRLGMQGALQNLQLPEPTAAGVGRGGAATTAVGTAPPAPVVTYGAPESPRP
jgi:general secretion pathway protein D